MLVECEGHVVQGLHRSWGHRRSGGGAPPRESSISRGNSRLRGIRVSGRVGAGRRRVHVDSPGSRVRTVNECAVSVVFTSETSTPQGIFNVARPSTGAEPSQWPEAAISAQSDTQSLAAAGGCRAQMCQSCRHRIVRGHRVLQLLHPVFNSVGRHSKGTIPLTGYLEIVND